MTSPPIAQRVESLDVVCGENAVTKAAVLTGQLHQSCSHLLGQKGGALNSALDSPTSETDSKFYSRSQRRRAGGQTILWFLLRPVPPFSVQRGLLLDSQVAFE